MWENITNIKDAFNQLIDKLESWMDLIVLMLPNIILALIVIVASLVLARSLYKLLGKVLNRFISNEAAVSVILSLLRVAIVLTGIFIGLGLLKLDKTVTSLLAGVGIVGLAFGFAFRETASNFISGLYMAFKSPINKGDLVGYEEHYGRIKNIGLRATTIITLQGQDIIVPNRFIFENSFIHYTINGKRRIDLEVGISYGDDLEKVEEVTLKTIKNLDMLKPGAPVDFYYKEFGSSSINFVVRYWINFTKETDYLKALSKGIKSIKKAYDQNDITITFPIRTLDFGIKGGTPLSEMLKEAGKESPEENG